VRLPLSSKAKLLLFIFSFLAVAQQPMVLVDDVQYIFLIHQTQVTRVCPGDGVCDACFACPHKCFEGTLWLDKGTVTWCFGILSTGVSGQFPKKQINVQKLLLCLLVTQQNKMSHYCLYCRKIQLEGNY
jgi:hypothetical protein